MRSNITLVTELCSVEKRISTANVAFSLTDSVFQSIHEKEMYDGAVFCGFCCVKNEILLVINFYVIQECLKLVQFLFNQQKR